VGWEGYWVRLTGFTATATAEAGEGTVAPSVTIGGGTIRYWDGLGYTDQSVAAVAPDGAEIDDIEPVDVTGVTAAGDIIQVQIGGTVTVQQTGTSEELDGTDRLEGKVIVGTPLVVEMSYQVTHNSSRVANLLVEFDAGGARATAIYQPAPDPAT
jgi:hypothetical protein